MVCKGWTRRDIAKRLYLLEGMGDRWIVKFYIMWQVKRSRFCTECWGAQVVWQRSGEKVPSAASSRNSIQDSLIFCAHPDGGEGVRGFVSSLYCFYVCILLPLALVTWCQIAYFMTNSKPHGKPLLQISQGSRRDLPLGYAALFPHLHFRDIPGWAPASNCSWNKIFSSGISIR